MQSDRYVYVIDDEHGQPCYVGVGKGNRMHDHVRDARSGKNKIGGPDKFKYLVDCLARGFTPQPYKVAESLTVADAIEYEKTLIAWYGRRDLGTGILLNASSGGFGVKDHAKSTLAKMSDKSLKFWDANPHFRLQMAQLQRERKPSIEELTRRSVSMQNRLASPEARAPYDRQKSFT